MENFENFENFFDHFDVNGDWSNCKFDPIKAKAERNSKCELVLFFPDPSDQIIADGLITKAQECDIEIDRLKAELKAKFPDVYEQNFGKKLKN